MQRPQLEHIIRAATGITGTKQFVVVGSQSILGQFPSPPDELLSSIEADAFSLDDPKDADLPGAVETSQALIAAPPPNS